jgi:hypothetical protein
MIRTSSTRTYTMLVVLNSPKNPAQKLPSAGSGKNMAMVAGSIKMLEAKMIGITPDIFSLMGR